MKGLSVLVSGAGGSIGSQLCERIVEMGAKKLTLVSLTEAGLYTIHRKLQGRGTSLAPILGSVGNECLMRSVLRGVDVVIHAAAHKHVPICEQNPIEAIENNVFGTWTLARTAAACGVKRFCLISTDKAVRPLSIMGATKRLAELLIADTGFAVRFGNVLDSAGSVLPLWREQIAKGGPLTLTDPRCERYFMSIPEAVGLVLDVIALKPQSGTFVLDMGQPKNLLTMANALMLESKRVEIKFIGLRPGEKLTEELYHGGEPIPTKANKVFKVDQKPQPINLHKVVQLSMACQRCDEPTATKLLWELVA